MEKFRFRCGRSLFLLVLGLQFYLDLRDKLCQDAAREAKYKQKHVAKSVNSGKNGTIPKEMRSKTQNDNNNNKKQMKMRTNRSEMEKR